MIRHVRSIQPVSAVLEAARVTADGAPVGTESQSRIADEKYECRYVFVPEGGIWNWYLCPPPPLELRFLGSSRPAAWFTSTRPFMSLYIMQTLSDVLRDCRFSNWNRATRGEALEVGL